MEARGKRWSELDWSGIRGRIATGLFKTPHEVGHMDLREVLELMTWWKLHPPAGEIAEAVFLVRSGRSSHGNRSNIGRHRHGQNDEVIRPQTIDEYQQFPIPLGPPKKARKLIRFPINIPGDTGYVDRTPAWIDAMRTA